MVVSSRVCCRSFLFFLISFFFCSLRYASAGLMESFLPLPMAVTRAWMRRPGQTLGGARLACRLGAVTERPWCVRRPSREPTRPVESALRARAAVGSRGDARARQSAVRRRRVRPAALARVARPRIASNTARARLAAMLSATSRAKCCAAFRQCRRSSRLARLLVTRQAFDDPRFFAFTGRRRAVRGAHATPGLEGAQRRARSQPEGQCAAERQSIRSGNPQTSRARRRTNCGTFGSARNGTKCSSPSTTSSS